MALVIGHRESKGATAASLNPLLAEVAEKANQAIDLQISIALGQTDSTPERVSYTVADYERDGPSPFLCKNCSYLEEGNYCTRVEGPENGLVRGQDTCRFWEPAPPMKGR